MEYVHFGWFENVLSDEVLQAPCVDELMEAGLGSLGEGPKMWGQ